MNQQSYRNLVSGNSKGALAYISRCLLRLISFFYSMIIRIRNFLYNIHILKSRSVDAAVICIGNITTGGTGKTPLVVWVCKFLHEKNICTSVLTRGYKAHKGKFSDEPAILAKNCNDCRILVNPDRLKSAQKAIEELGAKVLVMDDGFQHRKLRRDIDILTIDSTCPFGYEKMLPAGLLREPLSSGIKRASAVVITRSNQVGLSKLATIEDKIKNINPKAIIAKAIHKPVAVQLMGQPAINLEKFQNKKIFAFCGIGNPESFIKTIKKLNFNLVGHKKYNDHYDYTQSDIDDIYEQAMYCEADLILSTQKDWTKAALFMKNKKEDIEFGYLIIEIDFINGKDKITELINNTIGNRIIADING